ncbi:MAG: alpha/beta fold hydrolase [Ginsengibacter sp.]
MKLFSFIFLLITISTVSHAQVTYLYPVHFTNLHIEKQDAKMAYMDVKPDHPNKKSVILFHGKNFNGYYWKDVIKALTEKGYRVIVPDQVGWGRSDKPDLHYSFHMLASNNKKLLVHFI